jgi:excisionase family DNA binding protein
MTAPAIDSVPELVTVEQLARRWGLKPDTLRAWARRGDIPSIKIGTLTMFHVADLIAFLEARKAS